ncbi:MAG: hypothetical protein C5B51_09825 [Terriglobia bacterium]|nr:MAG: hypothetical protein C5B51_09825 [Terriglobia bacterium]
MAHSARDKLSRRSWLLAGLALPLYRARAASFLTVSFDGDNLHLAAPQLHFLTGKPLNRLMDGSAVVFFSQLTIFHDERGTVFRRAPERLTVSYDVWEEKFKVVMAIDRRNGVGLSMGAAETWCLENLAISALGLDPGRPFWLRFDLRAADEKELSSVVGDPGISIRGLIEVFSRKAGADQPHWSLAAGPLRLSDLPRTRRGSRG